MFLYIIKIESIAKFCHSKIF